MASQEVLTALESLHRELDKLEPAIKHVEAAQQVVSSVKLIPQKHLDFLREVKDSDRQHKDDLRELFEKELSGISTENNKLQKVTEEILKQIKQDNEESKVLRDLILTFHERVEKINFPERLDKTDANVAGIMAAIQSVQSRLDVIERNITDRLRDLTDYQKETRANFKVALEKTDNSIKILFADSRKASQKENYVTWGLLLVSVFGITMLIARAMKLI